MVVDSDYIVLLCMSWMRLSYTQSFEHASRGLSSFLRDVTDTAIVTALFWMLHARFYNWDWTSRGVLDLFVRDHLFCHRKCMGMIGSCRLVNY
jgi:hypothetical protein